MLAVALNYIGVIEEKDFGSMFVQQFNDFKVVKLSPYDDGKSDRLELCQPEEYEELVKHVQKEWDPSETFLELRGLKVRLQKAVRQMFFFDEEKEYEKVLLEGSDGISDFPWAMQIVMIKLPVMGGKPNRELIRKADVIILNNSEGEESRDFIARVKRIRPNTPIFMEKLQESWSQELTDSLEASFSSYLEKRQKITAMLTEKYPQQSISCEQARRMAGKLRVSSFLFGNVCDECGYTITHCGLSCF